MNQLRNSFSVLSNPPLHLGEFLHKKKEITFVRTEYLDKLPITYLVKTYENANIISICENDEIISAPSAATTYYLKEILVEGPLIGTPITIATWTNEKETVYSIVNPENIWQTLRAKIKYHNDDQYNGLICLNPEVPIADEKLSWIDTEDYTFYKGVYTSPNRSGEDIEQCIDLKMISLIKIIDAEKEELENLDLDHYMKMYDVEKENPFIPVTSKKNYKTKINSSIKEEIQPKLDIIKIPDLSLLFLSDSDTDSDYEEEISDISKFSEINSIANTDSPHTISPYELFTNEIQAETSPYFVTDDKTVKIGWYFTGEKINDTVLKGALFRKNKQLVIEFYEGIFFTQYSEEHKKGDLHTGHHIIQNKETGKNILLRYQNGNKYFHFRQDNFFPYFDGPLNKKYIPYGEGHIFFNQYLPAVKVNVQYKEDGSIIYQTQKDDFKILINKQGIPIIDTENEYHLTLIPTLCQPENNKLKNEFIGFVTENGLPQKGKMILLLTRSSEVAAF